jgi:hypothetical protein
MIGFILTIAFYSSIASGFVGLVWALAVGAGVLAGLAWGAGLEALLFVTYGMLGTSSGRISYRESTFAVGSMLLPLNAVVLIVALVVWGIRALF